jgi:hypothetical protein
MLDNLLQSGFRDLRKSVGTIIRTGLVGALVGFLLAEFSGLLFDGNWPARIFVHLAALALALTLGYAVALTTAAVITVRGLRSATQQFERATRSAMGTGFRTVESVVDADEKHQHAG